MPKKIAIVTGASSGLGRNYVRRLSTDPVVEEIWAIARREDRLQALQKYAACPVRPLPMDLTKPESIAELERLLQQETPVVSVLVCAAGFGKMGLSQDIPPQDNRDMIDLNCKAAVDVTTLCLPYLKRGSRVLEICSTAAFQPMPGINVYGATKAFLYSYTKALHHELLPRGIHVTAVCPYWVKDTEFISVAKQGREGDFKRFPLASKSKSVVSLSLAASALNLWVVTPGIVCTLHRLGAKGFPHFMLAPLVDLARKL